MRNVIVIPGEIWIKDDPQTLWEKGRPIYFSQKQAQSWVGSKDAEWLGTEEQRKKMKTSRIFLTQSGQRRFLEMLAMPSMNGDSSRLGKDLVEAYRNAEPWAAVFLGQIRDRRLRLPVVTSSKSRPGNNVVRAHNSIRVVTEV